MDVLTCAIHACRVFNLTIFVGCVWIVWFMSLLVVFELCNVFSIPESCSETLFLWWFRATLLMLPWLCQGGVGLHQKGGYHNIASMVLPQKKQVCFQ